MTLNHVNRQHILPNSMISPFPKRFVALVTYSRSNIHHGKAMSSKKLLFLRSPRCSTLYRDNQYFLFLKNVGNIVIRLMHFTCRRESFKVDILTYFRPHRVILVIDSDLSSTSAHLIQQYSPHSSRINSSTTSRRSMSPDGYCCYFFCCCSSSKSGLFLLQSFPSSANFCYSSGYKQNLSNYLHYNDSYNTNACPRLLTLSPLSSRSP